tara:strand:- start:1626 stop:2450 length:825 start_codon:yes stop_codon:yes gene_type:complete
MVEKIRWAPVEGDSAEILAKYNQPLSSLAKGDVPAFVMRQAFNSDDCAGLVQRFYERGLIYDPRKTGESVSRIDIGTSLGRHRNDLPKFFEHARKTLKLYETLFVGFDDPVAFMHKTLADLAPDKRVVVARESDGSLYGPAIFRTYYEGVGHTPHFDSVRKRTKLLDLEVSRFEKQFAAILCFQNSFQDAESGQALLYNCQWTEELSDELPRFREYANSQDVESVRIDLNPGDFYIFCSETIHEVPPPKGDQPRIVLASFFAMSDTDEEIYVWA